PQPGEVTLLLQQWRVGDREAEKRLFELVLPELRRLAHHYMRGERRDHTLQPTELVTQIYLKLVAAKDRDWQNRGHFFAIAARAMRRFLIDYARTRPDVDVVPIEELDERLLASASKMELAVTIDRLLEELEKENSEQCAIVELRFFLGLTDQETADALGLKLRTMQRAWQDARHWLFQRVEPRLWKGTSNATSS